MASSLDAWEHALGRTSDIVRWLREDVGPRLSRSLFYTVAGTAHQHQPTVAATAPTAPAAAAAPAVDSLVFFIERVKELCALCPFLHLSGATAHLSDATLALYSEIRDGKRGLEALHSLVKALLDLLAVYGAEVLSLRDEVRDEKAKAKGAAANAHLRALLDANGKCCDGLDAWATVFLETSALELVHSLTSVSHSDVRELRHQLGRLRERPMDPKNLEAFLARESA